MAGWWFSPGTLVSSTKKTDRHDITEILLKVALSTTNHQQPPCHIYVIFVCLPVLVSNTSWLWVTWWVSYKRPGLLILCEYLGSPLVFDGGPCCSLFWFSVLLCLSSSCVLRAKCCQCLDCHFVFSLMFISNISGTSGIANSGTFIKYMKYIGFFLDLAYFFDTYLWKESLNRDGQQCH